MCPKPVQDVCKAWSSMKKRPATPRYAIDMPEFTPSRKPKLHGTVNPLASPNTTKASRHLPRDERFEASWAKCKEEWRGKDCCSGTHYHGHDAGHDIGESQRVWKCGVGMCRKVLPRLTTDEQAAAKLELENTQALALL